MAARVRVGIIGAGIVGCAAAFELARRGADVTVFDSRSPGGGATHASAGILAPYIEGHDQGPLLELAVRALQAYDAFVEQVRHASNARFEYRRSGTIEVAESEQRADVLRARTSGPLSKEAGLEWIDAAQLRELEPAIRPTHIGGLLCRAHAHVAVPPFLSAVVKGAEAHSATFRDETPVKRISLDSVRCAIETADGSHPFDHIVVSAGSWSSLVDPLGEIRDSITPIRGQLVVLRWRGARVDRVLWGRSCYIVPWNDGTLLVGATSENVGFDERATVEGVSGLLAAAGELLSDLGSAIFQGVRVGLRPASRDGLPIIAPSAADPRLFYATGHFRNGVLLAPLTANLVANYLLKNGA